MRRRSGRCGGLCGDGVCFKNGRNARSVKNSAPQGRACKIREDYYVAETHQKFLYNCKRNISHPSNDFEIMCDRIESADIVIWDDITCAKSTDYEHQILFQYIDDRISQGKANIYTGNDSKDSCIQKLGDKLTSRIWSGNVIELKGTDKRGYKYG